MCYRIDMWSVHVFDSNLFIYFFSKENVLHTTKYFMNFCLIKFWFHLFSSLPFDYFNVSVAGCCCLSKFKSTQHHNLAVAADDDDCDVVAPLSFSTSSLCIAYAQLPFNQRVEKQKKTTTQIYYHRRYWWVLFYHFTQRRARVMILLRMDFVFSAYLIIA